MDVELRSPRLWDTDLRDPEFYAIPILDSDQKHYFGTLTKNFKNLGIWDSSKRFPSTSFCQLLGVGVSLCFNSVSLVVDCFNDLDRRKRDRAKSMF